MCLTLAWSKFDNLIITVPLSIRYLLLTRHFSELNDFPFSMKSMYLWSFRKLKVTATGMKTLFIHNRMYVTPMQLNSPQVTYVTSCKAALRLLPTQILVPFRGQLLWQLKWLPTLFQQITGGVVRRNFMMFCFCSRFLFWNEVCLPKRTRRFLLCSQTSIHRFFSLFFSSYEITWVH